jgi:Protein of unknown function (DUF3990)
MAWVNAPEIVYHGTIEPFANDIRQAIDLAKCKPINDFGLGFYVTTHLTQAQEMANLRYRRASQLAYRRQGFTLSLPAPVAAAVVQFTIDRVSVAALNTLVFVRPTADWKDFVMYCRSNGRNHYPGGAFYDVVYGPVSLFGGEAKPDSDQISLHSLAAISVLTTRGVMVGGPYLPEGN